MAAKHSHGVPIRMEVPREAWGIRFGLPSPKWLIEIGTLMMRTESELVLKSRRVAPGRLLAAGFQFLFPEWSPAARELVARWRQNSARDAGPSRFADWTARPGGGR
jgi:hypothetical protein